MLLEDDLEEGMEKGALGKQGGCLPCRSALNIPAYISPLWRKKSAWFTILFHAPLHCCFDMKLILCYANCITSASSSFNSSIDKDGT